MGVAEVMSRLINFYVLRAVIPDAPEIIDGSHFQYLKEKSNLQS